MSWKTREVPQKANGVCFVKGCCEAKDGKVFLEFGKMVVVYLKSSSKGNVGKPSQTH